MFLDDAPAERIAIGSRTTVWLRALAGALALSFGSIASARTDVPATGEVLAEFELGAPGLAEFTLHGTLPLPPGVYPRADGQMPFQVIDPDGGLVPAQVEIVSRYPRLADGADVVEVLARVQRGGNVQAGQRVRYAVVYSPCAPGHAQPAPSVSALLSRPGAIELRGRDVFGHVYRADLYRGIREREPSRWRTLRRGRWAAQDATHEVLLPYAPIPGPEGTLPHAAGVHAYFTRWAGEAFLSLDLRVHNALSGLDPLDPSDDALNEIYLRELELVLPREWLVFNAFDDPFFGPPRIEGRSCVWPILAPLDEGRLHVLPRMAQMQRRLVIVLPGQQAAALSVQRERTLAFACTGTNAQRHELYSWGNPASARYFPQRSLLPGLGHLDLQALRAADQNELLQRADDLKFGHAGAWPAPSAGLGWAHPWGLGDGGMPGGLEIHILDGITTACAASSEGYRRHQLEQRMLTDRQRNVLFNLDGSHTALEQWQVEGPNGPYNPVWWYNAPMLWAADPFGFAAAPRFHSDTVRARNLDARYEAALMDYDPIDEAHLVRYTRNAKALVWLGNDALAKDDLRAQAEGFRFAWNELPMDGSGTAIVSGMLAAQRYVEEHPGWGFPFSRAEGWGIDTMNAAYSIGDLEFRRRVKPWYDAIVDLVEAGQSTCTGVLQSTPFVNVFNAQYRCRQSIEAAIEENALVGMRESVFGRADPRRTARVDAVLAKSFRAMISPAIWDPVHHGPGAMLALGPFDNDLPPFCGPVPADGTYGFADLYQFWPSIGYAWELTGQREFLERAEEALGGDLLERLEASGLENLANRASLLALAQRL